MKLFRGLVAATQILAVLVAILCFSQFAHAGRIEMGNWSFVFSGTSPGATVDLTVDRIVNQATSGNSGTLRLELWAIPAPFASSTITGQLLASRNLGQLDAGQQYADISTGPLALTLPQSGTWYIALMLVEVNSDENWTSVAFGYTAPSDTMSCSAEICTFANSGLSRTSYTRSTTAAISTNQATYNLGSGSMLRLSASIQAGSALGTPADIYITATTSASPNDLFYLDPTLSWGTQRAPVVSNIPLADAVVPNFLTLPVDVLPAGAYRFGLDVLRTGAAPYADPLATGIEGVFLNAAPQAQTQAAGGDDYSGAATAAGRLSIGGSASGNIEALADRDWFRIDLIGGATYQLDLRRNSLFDPLLYLFDSAGNLLRWNDDDGEWPNSRIVYTAERSGTYYLGAAAYGDRHIGTYVLSAAQRTALPSTTAIPVDYFAATSATGRLAIGDSANGTIAGLGERDWVGVHLSDGITYQFDLHRDSLPNPYLYLYDGTGKTLASNDDGGGYPDARITYTAASAGRYFLCAAANHDESTGTYTLSAAQQAAPTPEPPCTYSISPTTEEFGADGGNGAVTVQQRESLCSPQTWTAVSTVAWITNVLVSKTSDGGGSVQYFVEANPNTTLDTGTIAIAGQTLTVRQAGVERQITVSLSGSGGGSVISSPAGISCGSTCMATYAPGTQVTLTANASAGSTFAGWAEACSGTGSCSITADANKVVTATFNTAPPIYTLTISSSGTGSGSVSWSEALSSCGTLPCALSYVAGTDVTLAANPNSGSSFSGWSGRCSGLATGCTITMNANQSVDAIFDSIPTNPTLTVETSGLGYGKVTAVPPGPTYAIGTVVTLTAVPQRGLGVVINGVVIRRGDSTFTGWSGACSGTVTTCEITMDADKKVTAGFYTPDATTYGLQIVKGGTGQGTVTSSSADIDCGSTCAAIFLGGKSVTLTASAAAGSVFKGWSGACTGTGSCTLTMLGTSTVTASFDIVLPEFARLSVSKVAIGGTGTGTVTSSPAGIDCGTNCSADFAYGSEVTLTATADTGSVISSWIADCNTGGGGEGGPSIGGGGSSDLQSSCHLSMKGDRSVSVTFRQKTYGLQVNRIYAGGGSLTVVSDPPGIHCPAANCYALFPAGTPVTLTATPSMGAVFAGWTGACSGTDRVCNLIMDGGKTANAYYGSASPPPPQTCASAPVTITVSSTYGAITWLNIQGVGAWFIPTLSLVQIQNVPKGLYTLTISTTLRGRQSQSINVGCQTNVVIFR